MEENNIYETINSLIDILCEHRNQNCLRSIPSVYPLSNGLTDDWEIPLSSLKDYP